MSRSRRVYRLGGWTLGLLGGVALMGWTYPGGLGAIYADFREFRKLQKSTQESADIEKELDILCCNVSERIHTKEELVEAYVTGQITFSELVQEFHALHRKNPATLEGLRCINPTATEHELNMMNAIAFVRSFTQAVQSERSKKALQLAEEQMQQWASRSSGN